MERHREMWLAVEKEHGVLTQREAYVALTAMEWADKTMLDKACEWLKEHYAPAGFVDIFRKAMLEEE